MKSQDGMIRVLFEVLNLANFRKIFFGLFAILLIFGLSACEDNGCIAADDFGQYETQSLVVYSNLKDMDCSYNLSNLEATANPSLKQCLTLGNPSVSNGVNANGNPQFVVPNIPEVGCNGFDDGNLKRLCAESCKAKCMAGLASETSTSVVAQAPNCVVSPTASGCLTASEYYQSLRDQSSASTVNDKNSKFEPNWTTTAPRLDGRNYGINIYPNSQISVKVQGSISLSPLENKSFANPLLVSPSDYFPNARISSSSLTQASASANADYPLDVSGNQSLDLIVYGKWNDGSSETGLDQSFIKIDQSKYGLMMNLMRRLVVYPIAHPSGYQIDNDSSTNLNKKSHKSPVPLQADPDAWQCDHKDSDPKKTDCSISDYRAIGYSNVDNNKAMAAFPISTEERLIGPYGGFIRHNGDGFLAQDEISSGSEVVVSNYIAMPASGLVSFKIVGADLKSKCTINADIINHDGAIEKYYSRGNPASEINLMITNLEVDGTGFKGGYYVRKGQRIVFDPRSWNGQWTTSSGIVKKCGIGMAMKIDARPAMICPHKAIIESKNPECFAEIGSDGKMGCSANDSQCMNPKVPNIYCPFVADQKSALVASYSEVDRNKLCRFSFKLDSSTGIYGLYSFDDATALPDAGAIEGYINAQKAAVTKSCFVAATKTTPESNHKTCAECNIARLASRNQKPNVNYSDSWQCYNLENYTGSYSKFQEAIKSLLANPSDSSKIRDLVQTKSLQKLEDGPESFSDFSAVKSTDIGSTPSLNFKSSKSFASDARLKFLLLDGDSLIESPSLTYSGAKDSYVANTGAIYIVQRSDFKFYNGQHLEAVLCVEDDKNGYKCNERGIELMPSTIAVDSVKLTSTALTQTQRIVQNVVRKTNKASSGINSYNAGITEPYSFDKDGNLVNNPTNLSSNHLATANQNICLVSNGFCHRYYGAVRGDSDEVKKQKSENVKKLRLAFKIKDPDGDYSDNSGQYNVQLKVLAPQDGISGIASSIIDQILVIIDGDSQKAATQKVSSELDSLHPNQPVPIANSNNRGLAENIYRALIGSPLFKTLLTMMMILVFGFYGLGYLIGTNDMKQATVVKMLFKIGIVYLFVDPNSGWYWFQEIFVNIFKGGTDYITFSMASAFDDSIVASGANYHDKKILFQSVDRVIALFINTSTQKKILALFFSGIFGWLYMFVIYYSMLIYFYAISSAILIYLTAQFFTSILFTMGPFFFLFLLFSITKDMFDNWVKALIGFALQQIFLVTTLSFFNQLILGALKSSLGYKICWDNILSIYLGYYRIELLSFWAIAGAYDIPANQKEFIDFPSPGAMPSFYSIMFIMVIATLMKKFVVMMTDIAASISEGIKATSLGSDVAKQFSDMTSVVGNGISGIYDKTLGNVVNRADKALFDSGKIADTEREAKRLQNKEDNKHIAGMRNAGNAAVSKFKQENADALIGKSKEEQRSILKAARDDGIKEYAEQKKIGEAKMNLLMKKSGLNYSGTNIFGAAISATKQSYRGRLFTSLGDQKVKTSFSQDEAREALSKIHSDKREEFLGATKSEINVKKSLTQNLSEAARNPRRAVDNLLSKAGGELSGRFGNMYKALIKDNERAEATKFLEKSGQIKRIGGLTSIFRSAKEKELINNQVIADGAVKNASYRGSDVKAIESLNRFAEDLRKQEKLPLDERGGVVNVVKNIRDKLLPVSNERKRELALQKAEALQKTINQERLQNQREIDLLKARQQESKNAAKSLGNSPKDEAQKQKHLLDAKRSERELKIREEKQQKLNHSQENIQKSQQIFANISDPKNDSKVNEVSDRKSRNAALKEFTRLNNEADYEKYAKKYEKFGGDLSENKRMSKIEPKEHEVKESEGKDNKEN